MTISRAIKVDESNAIEVMKDETMYVFIYLSVFNHAIMKQAKNCTLNDLLSEDNLVVQIKKD